MFLNAGNLGPHPFCFKQSFLIWQNCGRRGTFFPVFLLKTLKDPSSLKLHMDCQIGMLAPLFKNNNFWKSRGIAVLTLSRKVFPFAWGQKSNDLSSFRDTKPQSSSSLFLGPLLELWRIWSQRVCWRPWLGRKKLELENGKASNP